MSACTQTGKPLIAILLAVYEPRLDWLREQLESLEKQTYPNLRLYVRDDCSRAASFEEIEACVRSCIRSFPCEIRRNEENLGSNRTFERLTAEAEGDYFAYCDQDDVWLPDKLAALAEAAGKEGVRMAYCDMSVIDGAGKELAQSLCQLRPRLEYVWGTDLAETYFFRNCTAGCSMLVHAGTAKEAAPFPEQTVCDQWIAIIAALRGTVAFVPEPLVRYRQHGRNQTGILNGVTDREDYLRQKVSPLRERLLFYQGYAVPGQEMRAFIEARLGRDVRSIWRYRRYSRYEAAFEIALTFLPGCVVRLLLRRAA